MKEQDYVDGILEMGLHNRTITTEVQDSFKKVLKRGIYKELYHRNMLSDVQLNSLINQQINNKTEQINNKAHFICTQQELLI